MYLSTEVLPCCCCVPSSNVALGEAPFPLGGCQRGWTPVQSSSSTFLLIPNPPRRCGSSWADVESNAAWAVFVLHVRQRYWGEEMGWRVQDKIFFLVWLLSMHAFYLHTKIVSEALYKTCYPGDLQHLSKKRGYSQFTGGNETFPALHTAVVAELGMSLNVLGSPSPGAVQFSQHRLCWPSDLLLSQTVSPSTWLQAQKAPATDTHQPCSKMSDFLGEKPFLPQIFPDFPMIWKSWKFHGEVTKQKNFSPQTILAALSALPTVPWEIFRINNQALSPTVFYFIPFPPSPIPP